MGDSILLFVWVAGVGFGMFAGWCVWYSPSIEYISDDWKYLTPEERLGVQSAEDAEIARQLIASRKMERTGHD